MLLLLLFAAGMLVLYIREKIASYSVKAVLLKSVVSVLFITVAVLGWYLSNKGILGIFVIIWLTFGLLGDIWLDLKYVFRDYDDQFTYAGFASFGIGHILYIVGLLSQYMSGTRLTFIIIPLILGTLLSLCNAVLEKPMKLHYGKMKGIVIGYGGTERNILRCWERTAHRYHFKLYSVLWGAVSDCLFPSLSLNYYK